MTAEPLSPGRTAAWALAVLVVVGAVNTLVQVALAAPAGPAGLRDDATIFSLGLILGSLAGSALLLWILRAREPRRDLALTAPRLVHFALWIVITAITIYVTGALGVLLGHPAVPTAWQTTFDNASSPRLLAFALVVVAPLFEEGYFRGFLHRGLAASRLGPTGAVLLIAVLFTLVHFPEDLWTATLGLVNALLLGLARVHTGSIVPGIAIHALLNATILVQLALA
jgi:membrane protease YdiL (CAAX protease family)